MRDSENKYLTLADSYSFILFKIIVFACGVTTITLLFCSRLCVCGECCMTGDKVDGHTIM